MITPDDIRRLDKDTIWEQLSRLHLMTTKKNVGDVKRDLLQWLKLNCDHKEHYPLYDLSSCMCECGTMYEYDWETEMNICANCGFQIGIEESSSFESYEEYEELERCIWCKNCEFQGDPIDKIENPFQVIEDLEGGW